ncbi:MAG: hypothetical protein JWO82_2786, partial [Akkermansiaceae bacterium]|nr:hypothetical protein [Akkermansiaceae bacterium]
MRFRRIQIPAFGPFTDFGLELPSQGGDFHLVYGPNEAGKSSMLRTLRSFLFGIDAQTSDGFLHDYKKLLITAELEKRDGTVATFQRRKGNKNTLLDAQGTSLADTALGEYLGGIDRAYFESMFGMGSTELRQGAAALLKGEGRLGELLFSASLGGTPVDKVIRGLEVEAATIFKGKAIGSIRATKRLLDESVKGAKEALMKPELWEEADRALTELLGEIGTLAAGKSALVDRRAWLERCRDALPISGQYRDALEQLAAVADLPALREEFAREIREARQRWTAAEDRLAPLGIQLTALQAQRAACELAPEILERKAEIHRLHYGVGLYRERTVTLGKKQLEQAQLKGRMDGLCQELEITTTLADLEALRISQARLLAVEQAAGALEEAGQKVAAAEKAATVLAGEIAELEGQVTSAHGDVAGLQAAVDRTARFEELAGGLATRTTKAAVELKRLDSLRARLPGAPGELKALRALELPLKSTVEGFREGFDALERRAETLATEQTEAARRVAELSAEIERRSRQKNLPSVQDLDEARTRREQGWSRVLREWRAGEAPLSAEPLETVYPALVKSADEIADRLRWDAEDVAQLEEKRLQRTGLQAAAEQAALGLAKISEERLALTTRWSGVAERAGLTGLMPREMAEWITGWEDFSRPWDFYEEARSRLDDDLA